MTSGAHTSGNEENPVTEVISIKFRGRGKTYYFDPAGVTARTGDTLVVETSKGMELGECVKGNHMVGDGDCVQPLRPVVRRATPDDLRIAELNRKREKEALGICRELIEKHKLEMKLVDVECSFEGNKILFFFTADGRVDFRELVKDLAGVFRTRIELRQIGVRDEAKMLGGLGICGRPFCCHQFLDDFQPVSTKMAKTQSMSLNPVKISGTCGRLMCCLRYEQEAYEDLLKHVPKNGAFVQTEDGYGSVTLVNLLRQNVKVKLDGPGEAQIRTYDADEDLTSKTDRQRNSYINFLPSLLVKWNVNDDFKVRGSFTQTLSRPKYSALVPSVNIKRSDNEITIGNPELKPTVSYNFDLSADYYFRSIGLISAGIFYKKIDDFIVDQVSTNYEYQGNTYTRFTQPKNAGNANLVGVELSYQRDFSFIAPALKCVGFYGTYTYTHSRVEDFNFEGRENEKDLSMPGSPEHTANASLYFEKGGLNLRLSYNFASDFIDEMGESTFYDRYYDKVNYMDVNASYTFGKKFKTTFYAEANNLLNQPLRYYQGTKDRTMQAEYYGVKVNAGVKINF